MVPGVSPLVWYIIHSVAQYYGIEDRHLIFGNRERKYSEPRQVAAYCLYKLAAMSYPAIARLFNKRSHRTIIYAVTKVEDWRNTPSLNRKAVDCINHILSYR